MNVVVSISRQIIVDDQRHLLDVNATGQEIRGDEDTRWTRTELFHNDIPLTLVHVSVHSGHSELLDGHLLREEIHLKPKKNPYSV